MFKQKDSNLQIQAAKLVEVAKAGDVKAIGAQLQVVGTACGACHETFRQPEKKQ